MVVVILTMVVGVVFNVSMGKQSKGLSNLALANVEALAQNESGNGNPCYVLNCYDSKGNLLVVYTCEICTCLDLISGCENYGGNPAGCGGTYCYK